MSFPSTTPGNGRAGPGTARARRRLSFAPSCAALVVAAVIAGATVPAAAVAVEPASPAPALEQLLNATFQGVAEAGGGFALSGGTWEGRPVAAGAASAPRVTLLRDFRLAGDLDGDGREEAVVLLAATAGGTGETSYLAVVAHDGEGPRNVATAAVGDRVQLRAGRIEGRRIVLDLVQGGAQDAGCCPGDLVTRSWEVKAGSLVEGVPAVTGRLSLETLAGTEWALVAWDRDEPAARHPRGVAAARRRPLRGERRVQPLLHGRPAGRNARGGHGRPGRHDADGVRRGRGRGGIAIPAALGGLRRMRFVGGRLGLTYEAGDGKPGAMLFERRPAPAGSPVPAQPLPAGPVRGTAAPSKFFSTEDGWLDLGNFLDSKYGFLPFLSPVTEPAVGYGAAGGLAFIDKPLGETAAGAGRPDVTFVGGLGTENGTWGAAAGDLRNWRGDRLQTLVGGLYASVNLDFYGIRDDGELSRDPLRYNLEPKGVGLQVKYRLGESRAWAGLAYAFVTTKVSSRRRRGRRACRTTSAIPTWAASSRR